MNSSPASSQISRSSCVGVGADALADLLEPRGVELDAGLLASRAARARAAARSRRSRSVRPRSWSCSRWRAASSWTSTARAACGSSAVDGQAALLAQLVERVAAARGVEQVGGDLGVEARGWRGTSPSALASWAIDRAVAGGARPARPGRRPRPRARRRRPRRRRSASSVVAREQLALGGPRAPRRPATSSSPVSVGDVRRRRPSATGIVRASAASGRGIASASAASSASSSRRSGSRSSHSRNTVAQAASGRARASSSASRSRSIGHVARPSSRAAWRAARRRRARSGSACAWRRRSRRRWPSTSSRSPKRCSSSAAVLSPMPGTPGMLSRRVALEADEVGDQLGRDAVAVDHALAVVDLGVGDAARRSS